jgi:hypothetical protein
MHATEYLVNSHEETHIGKVCSGCSIAKLLGKGLPVCDRFIAHEGRKA